MKKSIIRLIVLMLGLLGLAACVQAPCYGTYGSGDGGDFAYDTEEDNTITETIDYKNDTDCNMYK